MVQIILTILTLNNSGVADSVMCQCFCYFYLFICLGVFSIFISLLPWRPGRRTTRGSSSYV